MFEKRKNRRKKGSEGFYKWGIKPTEYKLNETKESSKMPKKSFSPGKSKEFPMDTVLEALEKLTNELKQIRMDYLSMIGEFKDVKEEIKMAYDERVSDVNWWKEE